MISFFEEFQNKSVLKFCKKEIERFCLDKQFARDCSRLEHYSKIGEWGGALEGHRVLEVGCGPGKYVAVLSSLGCDVIGVDPHSFEYWSFLEKNTSAKLKSGQYAEQLPFPSRSFDAVSCLGALLYFDDPDKALREIYRVLKPEGHLIIRNVNRRNLYTRLWRKNLDPASSNTYSIEELISFLEGHGFITLNHFAYGFFPPLFNKFWWYFTNGILSLKVQKMLSDLTPPSCRLNDVVFLRRGD